MNTSDGALTGAIALGINNSHITDTVHAGIKNSTLKVGAVDVNAKNTSDITAEGGVAALSLNLSKSFLLSLGASISVTNITFDNKVTADVDNSTINAEGDVNIQARDDHKSDETVVSAAVSSGAAVAINRMSTSVNSGLADLKSDDMGKTLSIGDLAMSTYNASKGNADEDIDKINAEYAAEKRFNSQLLLR